MKKILATLLAMSMIFATTVAFAAVPVETSVNPEITVTVDDVVTMDMGDGHGERTFAVANANLTLPEGTLSEKITYNSITKLATGTGIASFTFNVAFSTTLFDMTTSYVVQTDGVGEWGYNANGGYMGGAMAGNANNMYVGTLQPMLTYYLALNDSSATAAALNAQTFATVQLGDLRIETFENATTAAYSTLYSTESSKADHALTVQVGADAPVVDETIEVSTAAGDDVAKTETYAVTVGSDLVGDNKVKAVLTNTAAEAGNQTQEVALSFTGFDGEAQAVFNIVVKFIDYANAATTSLAIEKVQ